MEEDNELPHTDEQTYREQDAMRPFDTELDIGVCAEIGDKIIAIFLQRSDEWKEDIRSKILASQDPIYLAVMDGDFTRTVELLSRKVASGFPVDHDFPQEDNTTPSLLTTAVCFGRTNIAKKMIEMGSAPVYRNWDPYFDASPLCLACVLGCPEMMNVLCEAGSNVNCEMYEIPLFPLSVVLGNLEIIQMLINRGCGVNELFENSSPLMLACLFGNVGVAKLLLQNGASRSVLGCSNLDVVFLGVASGDKDTVSLLMETAVSTQIGSLALLSAVAFGFTSMVEYLLVCHGINLNEQIELDDMLEFLDEKEDVPHLKVTWEELLVHKEYKFYITSAALALLGNKPDLLELLLQNGAEIHSSIAGCFYTYAFYEPDLSTEIAELLLHYGCPDRKSPMGFLPIHEAAFEGSQTAFSKLTDLGSNPDAISSDLFTPSNLTCLHLACLGCQPAIVAHLLKAKCDPNLVSSSGVSPIFLAVQKPVLVSKDDGCEITLVHPQTDSYECRQRETIALLIDAGADIQALTPDGKSVLDFAEGDERLCNVLEEFGAKDGRTILLQKNQEQTEIIQRQVSDLYAKFNKLESTLTHTENLLTSFLPNFMGQLTSLCMSGLSSLGGQSQHMNLPGNTAQSRHVSSASLNSPIYTQSSCIMQEKPSLHLLNRCVLKKVAAKWYFLGLELQLQVDTLDQIKVDYRHAQECCLEMMKWWINGNGKKPISWSTIQECLRHIDFNDLADQLQEIVIKNSSN